VPVKFDEYADREFEFDPALRPGTNGRKIIDFLLEHPATGFTPSEIRDAIDIPRGSVGPTLQRLEERDLVRHEEPYWAIGADHRLASYSAMLLSMKSIEERDEYDWDDVDPEAWSVNPEDAREAQREHRDER